MWISPALVKSAIPDITSTTTLLYFAARHALNGLILKAVADKYKCPCKLTTSEYSITLQIQCLSRPRNANTPQFASFPTIASISCMLMTPQMHSDCMYVTAKCQA